MKKSIILMTCMAAILLTACNDELQPVEQPEDYGILKIEAILPESTKVTASNFEAGDVIGVWASAYEDAASLPLQVSGNWINNTAATYSEKNSWTGKNMYWADGKMDVCGYYPYMEDVSSITAQPWSVQLDQSTASIGSALGGYEASDFLWAKDAGIEKADGKATLAFRHCCSRLVVKLVKGPDYTGSLPDASELYLHNTVPAAKINFTNGAVTKDVFGDPASIKARKIDNETFEAIVVPQRLETIRPFIEYIANGVSYLYESSFAFRAGVSYTVSLTINSNPEQIHIEIEPGTGSWNN